MSLERDQSHDSTSTSQASTDHDDHAPGRTSRSALLRKPDHAVASGLLSRKARDANGVEEGADAAVASASSSSGSPLPETLMRKFESSLGADLSGVRVHTGAESAAANDAVGARAYTMGNDIHFGAGQFDPHSASGEHLIAHEVAHTVQQSGGASRMQFKLEVSSPGDALELEADRAADAMVSGAPASVGTARGVARDAVLRDFDPNKKKKPAKDPTDPKPSAPATGYVPSLTATAASPSLQLNAKQVVTATVENAVDAPEGTVFNWYWFSMGTNAGLVAEKDPPAGATATLCAKLLSLDGTHHNPSVAVSYGEKGGKIAVAPAASFKVTQPAIAFDMEVAKQGESKVNRTKNQVGVGDTIRLRAVISNVPLPEEVLTPGLFGGGSETAVVPKWDGTTLTYEYVVLKMAPGGQTTAKMQLKTKNGEPRYFDHHFAYTIFADSEYMDKRCNLARGTLEEKFTAAIKAVKGAFGPYNEAYMKMMTALGAKAKEAEAEAEAQKKLFLKWGLGGLGVIEAFAAEVPITPKVVADLSDDLKEKILKVGAVPTPPKQSTPASGGTNPVTSGLPAGTPAGFNPSGWAASVEKRSLAQKGELLQLVNDLQNGIQKAGISGKTNVFDFDPNDLVASKCGVFDEIAAGCRVVDEMTYATELWSIWLKQHGWIAVQTYILTLPVSWEAKSNIESSELQANIAAQVGGKEAAAKLIQACVPEAKAKAEAEAAKKNAETPHPAYPSSPKHEGA